MTTFSNKINSSRKLQLESLENRELLSVNPLGIDDDTPIIAAGNPGDYNGEKQFELWINPSTGTGSLSETVGRSDWYDAVVKFVIPSDKCPNGANVKLSVTFPINVDFWGWDAINVGKDNSFIRLYNDSNQEIVGKTWFTDGYPDYANISTSLSAGTYWLGINGKPRAGGDHGTFSVNISVVAAPTITSQPQSITIKQGNATTLSVSATLNGYPGTLKYDFWFNGQIVSHDSTYTLPTNLAPGTYQYDVWVYTERDGVWINTEWAYITVTPAAPTIDKWLQNKAEYTQGGASPTVSTGATLNGVTGTVKYNWHILDSKNGNRIDFLDPNNNGKWISEFVTTNSTFTLPSNLAPGTYWLDVDVFNETKNVWGETVWSAYAQNGNITYQRCTITVKPVAPTITKRPQSATYVQGQSATQLSVEADKNSSSGTLKYNWFYNNGTAGWTPVESATDTTSSTFTLPDNLPPGTHLYDVHVWNEINGVPSEHIVAGACSITILPAPKITEHPKGESYKEKESAAALRVKTDADETKFTPAYQWYKTTNPNEEGTKIEGAISATLDASKISTETEGVLYYYVMVTFTLNENGYTTPAEKSKLAKIVVGKEEPPQINPQPKDADRIYIENGSADALFVDVSNKSIYQKLEYQWYSNTQNSNDGGTKITGATSATYTPQTNVPGTLYYYVEVIGITIAGAKTDAQTSSTARVEVAPLPTQPVITTQPQPTAKYMKDKTAAALTVKATGNGTLSYQWYKTTDPNKEGTKIDGATSATLDASKISTAFSPKSNKLEAETTYYYCVVTNTTPGGTKTAESDAAAIVVAEDTYFYDEIARSWAYDFENKNHDKGDTLDVGGELYKITLKITNLGNTGLDAYGLISTRSGSDDSLLVFRGTDTDTKTGEGILELLRDVFADADRNGIGYNQFHEGLETLLKWAKDVTASSLSVIGHSLGGALAQWFAAEWTSQYRYLANVITYNAPGISAAYAEKFKAEFVGKIQHNISNGDIVSMAGEKFIAGGKTEIRYYDSVGGMNILENHTKSFENRSYQNISAERLNNFWFTHTDMDYWKVLGTACAVSPLFLAAVTRGTTELFRQSFGSWSDKLSDEQWSYTVSRIAGIGPLATEVNIVTIQLKETPLDGLMYIHPYLEIDTNQSQWSAKLGGKFKFGQNCPDIDIFGTINSEGLWTIGAKATDIGLPIKATYGILTLQDVGLEIGKTITQKNEKDETVTTNLYVAGSVKFDVFNFLTMSGPAVEAIVDNFNAWTPITIKAGALGTLTGNIWTIGNNTKLDAHLVFLHERILKADIAAELNFNPFYYYGIAQVEMLDGLFKGDAKIVMQGPSITVTAQGEIRTPNWDFLNINIGGFNFWGLTDLRNRTLASGGVGLYLSPFDGDSSNDGIAVWGTFHLPEDGWKVWNWVDKRVGVWMPLGSGSSLHILGAQEILDLGFRAAPLAAGITADGIAAAIPNFNEPADYIIAVKWNTAKAGAVGTITLANGTVLTEKDIQQSNYIAVMPDLCTDTQRAYIVHATLADIQTWQIDILGVEGEEMAVFEFTTPPVVDLTISMDSNGKMLVGGVIENIKDAATTQVTFYLDAEDGEDFSGASVYTTTYDKINEKWTLSGVAAGTYRIYVRVFDGVNVPVEAYLKKTITVTDAVMTTDSTAAITPVLEFAAGNAVYLNLALLEKERETAALSVTIMGGNLTVPREFYFAHSAIIYDADGIGHLTKGVAIGSFASGHYTVSGLLKIDGEEKLFSTEFDVFGAPVINTTVTTLSAVATGSSVQLTWDAVGEAVSYSIFRSGDGGKTYQPITSDITKTTFTDTNVPAGTYSYYCVVSSSDAASEFSNITTVTVKPALVAGKKDGTAATSSVTATFVVEDFNRIEEKNSKGKVTTTATSYIIKVYAWDAKTGKFKVAKTVTVKSTAANTVDGVLTYTLTGLKANTLYQITVQAKADAKTVYANGSKTISNPKGDVKTLGEVRTWAVVPNASLKASTATENSVNVKVSNWGTSGGLWTQAIAAGTKSAKVLTPIETDKATATVTKNISAVDTMLVTYAWSEVVNKKTIKHPETVTLTWDGSSWSSSDGVSFDTAKGMITIRDLSPSVKYTVQVQFSRSAETADIKAVAVKATSVSVSTTARKFSAPVISNFQSTADKTAQVSFALSKDNDGRAATQYKVEFLTITNGKTKVAKTLTVDTAKTSTAWSRDEEQITAYITGLTVYQVRVKALAAKKTSTYNYTNIASDMSETMVV